MAFLKAVFYVVCELHDLVNSAASTAEACLLVWKLGIYNWFHPGQEETFQYIGDTAIKTSHNVRNLGVLFDTRMNMESQIISVTLYISILYDL